MASTLKPQPGDLIEIFRGPYQHWAVYVGGGFVVHLAPDSEVPGAGTNRKMSVLAERAIVKKEKLREVVGTDRWKINNALDNEYEPRPVDVIVKKACALANKILPYSVISSNCEHFVNELRYGKKESRQVRRAGEAVMAAGEAVVMGSLAAPMMGPGAFALAGGLPERRKKDDLPDRLLREFIKQAKPN